MRTILHRLQQRFLACALRTWCLRVEEVVEAKEKEERQHYVISLVIRRMVHRALSLAFQKWCLDVAAQTRNKQVMNRVIMRYLNRLGWLVFHMWLRAVEATRLENDRLEKERALVQRRQYLMTKTIKRMLSESTASGALQRQNLA